MGLFPLVWLLVVCGCVSLEASQRIATEVIGGGEGLVVLNTSVPNHDSNITASTNTTTQFGTNTTNATVANITDSLELVTIREQMAASTHSPPEANLRYAMTRSLNVAAKRLRPPVNGSWFPSEAVDKVPNATEHPQNLTEPVPASIQLVSTAAPPVTPSPIQLALAPALPQLMPKEEELQTMPTMPAYLRGSVTMSRLMDAVHTPTQFHQTMATAVEDYGAVLPDSGSSSNSDSSGSSSSSSDSSDSSSSSSKSSGSGGRPANPSQGECSQSSSSSSDSSSNSSQSLTSSSDSSFQSSSGSSQSSSGPSSGNSSQSSSDSSDGSDPISSFMSSFTGSASMEFAQASS